MTLRSVITLSILFFTLTNYARSSATQIDHTLSFKPGFGINYNNDGVGGETDMVLRQIPDFITEFLRARPMRNTPGTDLHSQYPGRLPDIGL